MHLPCRVGQWSDFTEFDHSAGPQRAESCGIRPDGYHRTPGWCRLGSHFYLFCWAQV